MPKLRLLAVLVHISSAVAVASPAGFASLPHAISFLSDCLDSNDSSRLRDATLRHKLSGFESLELVHGRTSLATRYAGRAFPTRDRSFTLGGHGSELGHVHVDFVKRDSLWYINSIWMCR